MDRRLWGMLVISSLSQMGSDMFQIFLPVYANGIGLSASAIGVMLSMLAAGSFVVRFRLVQLIAAIGEARLLAIAFCTGALAFAFVPLLGGAIPLAFMALAFGFSQGCSQPLVMMMIFKGTDSGSAGEAIGLRMTTNNFWRMVGPVMFGGLASLMGLLAVFWINGLLLTIGARLTQHRGENAGKAAAGSTPL